MKSLRGWQASTLLLAPLAASVVHADSSGNLTVLVTGLESSEGQVIIAVIDSAEAYDAEDRAVRDARPAPAGGTASATFEDLPLGDYAVKVFHDENGNGKLDTNFVGIPKERFGFSNNAMGRFGPPDFEQSRFSLDQPAQQIEIEAKRF
jgi:uncharacterized protein (DUF2141 family)